MNFDNDGFDRGIGRIVAIIETGRIEAVAEVSQVGQHTDRSLRSLTEMFPNKLRNGLGERNFRIPEMIPAAEAGQIEAFVCPQWMNMKKGRQLFQIEKHEKQAILKHVGSRPESPVPDRALVYATMHGQSHVILNRYSETIKF